jgi:uncharacterized protein YjbI with pentapeptide repeats
MANRRHHDLITQGVAAWNKWRKAKPRIRPDLSGVDLAHASLKGADFHGTDLSATILRDADLSMADLGAADLTFADLYGANLRGAHLIGAHLRAANLMKATLADAKIGSEVFNAADFEGANLSHVDLHGLNLSRARFYRANLTGANLRGATMPWTYLAWAFLRDAQLDKAELKGADLTAADLCNTDLRGADLSLADLTTANLSYADLTGAILRGTRLPGAILVKTTLDGATLEGCWVYGVSVWDVNLKGVTRQSDLSISKWVPTVYDAQKGWHSPEHPPITVENLALAQFISLVLDNEEFRDVIDTITNKAVLILGRFTPERKAVLNAMRAELRQRNLVPIVFDFERSAARDLSETIKILAGLSLFVIADITNPKSAPLELQATVPDYQIPFVTIIEEGEEPFPMFRDLWSKYDWVLQPVTYRSVPILLQVFEHAILDRAREKRKELARRKTRQLEVLSADDFLRTRD